MKTKVLALPLVAALAASPLHAQPLAEHDGVQLGNTVAEQLEAAAERLATDPANYHEAASAYEQAAGLRGWGDPRSAELLINAARVYHAAGEPRSAVRVLLQLADQSLAGGRVVEAADALIDCSWVASDAGLASLALEAGARALLLAESPLLPEGERTRLRARLGLAPKD